MVWQDFNQKVFRFAVLKHVRETDIHWDLLLQLPLRPLLATWQIRRNPAQWEHELQPIPALAIPDHRLIYLDFQGEISGGRGHVTRIDGGKVEISRVDEDVMEFCLHGQLLRGHWHLTHDSNPDPAVSQHWHLRFNKPKT